MYRRPAEKTEDVFIKQEILELAAVCEEVANNIEDRLTGGTACMANAARSRLTITLS
jgi:hypothetical protein